MRDERVKAEGSGEIKKLGFDPKTHVFGYVEIYHL